MDTLNEVAYTIEPRFLEPSVFSKFLILRTKPNRFLYQSNTVILLPIFGTSNGSNQFPFPGVVKKIGISLYFSLFLAQQAFSDLHNFQNKYAK